ncbi:hypothetical protein V202x_47190 [Gimesia aquarii]|uniref:Uncharacterized protein n=1 Tax=Gimesia aquarii TaxID=2527964 RepID=A0A517X1C8_9PLAN|nr:hypothetical protein V202x_47190 [Gimesia aquarii]
MHDLDNSGERVTKGGGDCGCAKFLLAFGGFILLIVEVFR